MAYLEVSPMVTALRESAGDFEMAKGWLNHIPSRHRFKVSKGRRTTLRAFCDCSFLQVGGHLGLELSSAFEDRYAAYWRLIEINREFASNFFRQAIVCWARDTAIRSRTATSPLPP